MTRKWRQKGVSQKWMASSLPSLSTKRETSLNKKNLKHGSRNGEQQEIKKTQG